jgi:valyl-tRNA synthetase
MTLAGSATGMDFAWRDEKVESYRNFANKIWNATRFCLMNAEGAAVDHKSIWPQINTDKEGSETANQLLSLADRWIVSRLNKTAIAVNRALDNYQFHEAVQLLYHFFWDDFCDWYIELVKDEITGGNAKATTRIVTILEIALRMLHPFMPYLTEELWLKLPGVSNDLHHAAYKTAEATIMLTSFPPGDASAIDEAAEVEMGSVIDVITKVRNIRAEMNISTAIKFTVHIAAKVAMQGVFKANKAQILKLARADKLVIADTLDVPRAAAKAVTNYAAIAVPLEGLIDFDVERIRLSNQIAKLAEEKDRLAGQLSNANFVDRAPAEKVQELRDRFAELEKQIETLNNNLEALD